MQRPDAREYETYYSLYVNQVPDGNILEILDRSIRDTVALLDDLPAAWVRYRYAPGKWTLGEVLGHVIDAERVFSYRGMCIARGDTTPLPSMDQDGYAASSNAGDRTLDSLLDELRAVRRSSIALFASLAPEAALRTGTASGFRFTVRTFPWILAGHEIHHRKVLESRYLAPLSSGETS